MKRIIAVTLFTCFVIGGIVHAAGKTSQTRTITITADSVQANNPVYDTSGVPLGLFIFRDLHKSKEWSGYIDVNTISSTLSADSALDTIAALLYTCWENDCSPKFLLRTDSMLSGTVDKGVIHFEIPADSIVGDRLMIQIIKVLYDTVDAHHGGTITYRVEVALISR